MNVRPHGWSNAAFLQHHRLNVASMQRLLKTWHRQTLLRNQLRYACLSLSESSLAENIGVLKNDLVELFICKAGVDAPAKAIKAGHLVAALI